MKKSIIAGILCITLGITGCITSCEVREQEEKKSTAASPSTQPTEVADAAETEGILPSRTEKKTVLESFGVLLTEENMKSTQKIYSLKEYDEVRNNDVSDWKDKQGNYKYPKGYRIACIPPLYRSLVAQQMPKKLLKEISTEELYQLIVNAPGDWRNVSYMYLGMLASYYEYYNFMKNFMEREDAAEVVHQHYVQYTKEEIEKYSKRYQKGSLYGTERRKRDAFQLTEGMEWFFLYQEGKEVPDEAVLGYETLKDWAQGNIQETADTPSPEETGAAPTPVPTAPARTAEKTVKEAFGAWLVSDKIIEWREKEYASREYEEIRYDDLSEWKKKQGGYTYPKAYEICFAPGIGDSFFAAQQMPQALLDEISTEELLQLILNAPGGWDNTYDSYLQMLSYYYGYYGFLRDLMDRKDAAEVVHQQYQKYTKKERQKYSKQNHSWQPKNQAQMRERGKFQLTEGLEWFFRYQQGKKVPDEWIFGYEWLEELQNRI